MISVEQALDIVRQHTPRLPIEEVPLARALGRVLAEAALADLDMPPFDRSAMDGFALRAEDLGEAPTTLRIIGQVRAGQHPEQALGPGEAMEVMTGAAVPQGATAVQQVEKTRRRGEDGVEVLEPVAPGTHLRTRGSEVAAGQPVLEAGRRIDAAAIAVLATVGQARVRVGRRPRVAVVVTGDELVDVEQTPPPGCIRNSNGYVVAAQIRQLSGEPVELGVVADEARPLEDALARGLEEDVLIVSGGVSVGVYDLVEPALDRLGVEVLFEQVAVKPGKPLVFGRRDKTLVFGLPGNPVSAQVTLDLFVRPALLRMQGCEQLCRPTVEVELTGPISNRSARRAHHPSRVSFDGGRLVAEPLRSTGSADIVAHARANALVVLVGERLRAEAGERATALLLERFVEGSC